MYEPVTSLLTVDSHCFNNGIVRQNMYMYRFVVGILLRVTACLRPQRGVTWEKLQKHFLCVLATFFKQKTYNVHANEGQPA